MNNMYLKYRYIDHFVVKIVYYLKYEIGTWKLNYKYVCFES